MDEQSLALTNWASLDSSWSKSLVVASCNSSCHGNSLGESYSCCQLSWRRESSKCNYYIICRRVIIKAIMIVNAQSTMQIELDLILSAVLTVRLAQLATAVIVITKVPRKVTTGSIPRLRVQMEHHLSWLSCSSGGFSEIFHWHSQISSGCSWPIRPCCKCSESFQHVPRRGDFSLFQSWCHATIVANFSPPPHNQMYSWF